MLAVRDMIASVMSAEVTQKQRINPNSLQNLKSFKPGVSGNPGGNYKHTPKLSNAFAKLLAMSPEDFELYEPANIAEELAYDQIATARDSKPLEALAIVKEISDRVEGKAIQQTVVANVTEIEAARAKFVAAVEGIMSELQCDYVTALTTLISVNPDNRKFVEGDE